MYVYIHTYMYICVNIHVCICTHLTIYIYINSRTRILMGFISWDHVIYFLVLIPWADSWCVDKV